MALGEGFVVWIPDQVQPLITFPTCAQIQLSVRVDFSPLCSGNFLEGVHSFSDSSERHFHLENSIFSVQRLQNIWTETEGKF